jgi:glycosyltransferase involved in cell wall biosynthesis
MNECSAPVPRLSVTIATHDNQPVLARGLESWRRYASDQPVELMVVEDGCSDGTSEYLERVAADGGWGALQLRVLHEDNVHELMCTNRGFREARGPLVLSWHDDMFLRASWFVPELLATFEAYPDLGLLSLSRGLRCLPLDEPVRTFADTFDWRRLQSTIGRAPWNWLRLSEVDAVMRPWVVRRACLDRVGPMDEAFRPTEWDEADLCYRIRAAGWRIATHGYERDGAYRHLLSTTISRTPSAKRQAAIVRNAQLFFSRWQETIAREHTRPLRSWWRRLSPGGAVSMVGAMARGLAHRMRPGRSGAP